MQNSMGSASIVAEILGESGFRITGRTEFPARPARYGPIPDLDPQLCEWLHARHPAGLYSHQTLALEMLLKGDSVCLATPTASGKSLVFMTHAVQQLLSNKDARVLALYPARALIQDQLHKWHHVLSAFDIKLGFIDGSVSRQERTKILSTSRVLLATPDVCHAWLLGGLDDRKHRAFLNLCRTLILDEAHVYNGVFGSNMAYFLRRLRAVSSISTIVSATATIGDPADFIEALTGDRPQVLTAADDGAGSHRKTVLVAQPDAKGFDATVTLLKRLTQSASTRFLAFGDSRRMVERIVAACGRDHDADPEGDHVDGSRLDEDDQTVDDALVGQVGIDFASGSAPASDEEPRLLPYRGGYEDEDRKAIQRALTDGSLAGVVSTSALELGLDIGDIDLVVLLTPPPSVKAFWQRAGRAGRQHEGVCVLLDPSGEIDKLERGLTDYIERPVEPSWMYVENRYIQFANALCAAQELTQTSKQDFRETPLGRLPETFQKMLANELNPSDVVPPDLYPLKQRAQGGPHLEFPVRTDIEKSFTIEAGGQKLGTVTFSQAMREAYPGAMYYYMARPFRVYRLDVRRGQILAKRGKFYTTYPESQTKAFPKFHGGLLHLATSEEGFVAEAGLQVSERVLGFAETRGSKKVAHRYGPESGYAQREINRFFETSGVCWSFPSLGREPEGTATHILQAFSQCFSVEERDLGSGTFFSKVGPTAAKEAQGSCIFDGVYGSLRLTERLALHFTEVVDQAAALAAQLDDYAAEQYLHRLRDLALKTAVTEVDETAGTSSLESDWVLVVAPGQPAIFHTVDGGQEVTVRRHLFNVNGLMYELEQSDAKVNWLVPHGAVAPINGATKVLQLSLVTLETREL